MGVAVSGCGHLSNTAILCSTVDSPVMSATGRPCLDISPANQVADFLV